jgi:hypothetical protein
VTRAIRLLDVPYDSGRHGVRHGAGPAELLAHGAADRLGRSGAAVERASVLTDAGFVTAFKAGRPPGNVLRDLVDDLARRVLDHREGGGVEHARAHAATPTMRLPQSSSASALIHNTTRAPQPRRSS